MGKCPALKCFRHSPSHERHLFTNYLAKRALLHIAKDFKSLQQKRKEIYDSTPDDKLDSSQALQENRTKLKELGDKLRDTLLLRIMIRRTRSDIEAFYQDDKTKQNLSFPEITPPKDLTYNLDEISHNLASDTIKFLDQSEQSSLGRYQYKRYPKDKQQNDKRIIITTDVLAEGVNLHRANIIINYDTPYNSTRLMQRIGRINRIGTPHKQIHICNFKPDYFTDSIIHIRAIASQKIQSFHYTLGEDSAIYDESEEFDSKKLFDESIKTQKEDLSKETLHKKALKDLYHSDKQAFQKIQSLPNKSRCFIQTKDQALSYAYLKSTHKGSNIFAPYCIQETSDNLLREEKARECSV